MAITCGLTLSSLVLVRLVVLNAEDIFDIANLFQVAFSSVVISLVTQASFNESQKFDRLGTAKPPLLQGSSAASLLTTTFF